MLVIVVNEHVADGWLEFLGAISLKQERFDPEAEAKRLREQKQAQLLMLSARV